MEQHGYYAEVGFPKSTLSMCDPCVQLLSHVML